MPAPPDHIVQSNLVLPPQSDSFEAVPFRRCQLLSGTNSNAHMSYPLQKARFQNSNENSTSTSLKPKKERILKRK